MGLFKTLKHAYIHKDSPTFVRYLRRKGIRIGEHCIFRSPHTTLIDKTRPELIEIGNYVDMNRYFTIMTHDYATSVFLRKYHDFLNSSGPVRIGNNVYFGIHCTVLKGVSIGNDCIIGAGSLVTHDIPSGSVAAGTPARVICSVDDYYARRREESVTEALELARTLYRCHNRLPRETDFKEEFVHWISGPQADARPDIPAARQLREAYPAWRAHHHARFADFNDFLRTAGLPVD